MSGKNGVYIVSAVRTPIGKFGGALADFTHPDLGTTAVRAALERAFGLPLPREREHREYLITRREKSLAAIRKSCRGALMS
jgi:hypothetical protein